MVGRPQEPRGSQWLRVAVPRLPRISNATDVEALACEPGVSVRLVTGAAVNSGLFRMLVHRPGCSQTWMPIALVAHM